MGKSYHFHTLNRGLLHFPTLLWGKIQPFTEQELTWKELASREPRPQPSSKKNHVCGGKMKTYRYCFRSSSGF